MDKIMPSTPISDVHLKQKELLERLSDGPVVLTSRSKPTAVLVSVEEWNRTVLHIAAMLAIVRKTRPWFTLPLYTLNDIRKKYLDGTKAEATLHEDSMLGS